MKKLFLLFMLNFTSIMSMYVPAPGPLMFTDTPNQKGAIYLTARNNPQLINEYNILSQFAQTLPIASQTYQGIVDGIRNAQTPLAIQTLEALENILIYMYQDKALYLKIPYLPGYMGIRQSWANITSYVNPMAWIKDTDPQLEQIINELNNLSNIASSKKYMLGLRIKSKVHIYHHWRKYMLVLAYILYDQINRSWDDSLLFHLYNDDDYEEAIAILKNDITSLTNFTLKQLQTVWSSFKYFYNRKEMNEKKYKEQRNERIRNMILESI